MIAAQFITYINSCQTFTFSQCMQRQCSLESLFIWPLLSGLCVSCSHQKKALTKTSFSVIASNYKFSHILTPHQTLFFVAMLMGGCLFVSLNIPRRSDALNFFSFLVSMAQGHLVLEDENKLHLAAELQQCVRRCFALHLESSSGTNQSIFTNTTIYDKGNYCH